MYNANLHWQPLPKSHWYAYNTGNFEVMSGTIKIYSIPICTVYIITPTNITKGYTLQQFVIVNHFFKIVTFIHFFVLYGNRNILVN